MRSELNVIGETATLERVLCERSSLARFGDGEFSLIRGRDCVSQRHDPALAAILRGLLRGGPLRCLIGIPRLDPESPKIDYWRRQMRDATGWLHPHRIYGSAFISRPDSAPWIATGVYWARVADLWRGRDVCLVRGSDKSLTPDLLEAEARSVREVRVPAQHAFERRRDILLEILEGAPFEIVLLCCGPTGTVLAADLAGAGLWAVDVGHLGMFWKRRHLEPAAALAEGRAEPLISGGEAAT